MLCVSNPVKAMRGLANDMNLKRQNRCIIGTHVREQLQSAGHRLLNTYPTGFTLDNGLCAVQLPYTAMSKATTTFHGAKHSSVRLLRIALFATKNKSKLHIHMSMRQHIRLHVRLNSLEQPNHIRLVFPSS